MAKKADNKQDDTKADDTTVEDSTATAKKASTSSSTKKKASTTTKKKTSSASAAAAKKRPPVKRLVKKPVARKIPLAISKPAGPVPGSAEAKPKKLPAAFLKKQQQKLLDLRESLVDQMNGVARETLRGGDGSESAFGMHQADAGSDSYDRDFALNLLSQEQDALSEIDEALMRIETGTYGVCEESGDAIPQLRLEAMPFARMTVACQERQDHQQSMGQHRQPVTSLFGLEEKDKTT